MNKFSIPFQADIKAAEALGCINYRVGYEVSNWLIAKLIKLQINHTMIFNYVFIDKSDCRFERVLRSRKFSNKPVLLVENKFKDDYGKILAHMDKVSIVKLK